MAPGSSGAALEGDTLVSLDFVHLFGRHLSTATTEALHGWTWSGNENITRTTIAAFAIVEATLGTSRKCQQYTKVKETYAIHIPTIFPATPLPNDRYPVIATII